jgi:hypothetical protein
MPPLSSSQTCSAGWRPRSVLVVARMSAAISGAGSRISLRSCGLQCAWCSTGAPGCPGSFFAAQFHFDARAARNGAALNVLRGDQILDGYTHRLVVGDLLV